MSGGTGQSPETNRRIYPVPETTLNRSEFYLEQGVVITEEDMRSVQDADTILLGAMGLQNVRFPNGTEIAPHLKIRTELGLFAGMRPVRAYPITPQRLSDPR